MHVHNIELPSENSCQDGFINQIPGRCEAGGGSAVLIHCWQSGLVENCFLGVRVDVDVVPMTDSKISDCS